MKNEYGNVGQIGNALYFMALLSETPVFATFHQFFKLCSKVSQCVICDETCKRYDKYFLCCNDLKSGSSLTI